MTISRRGQRMPRAIAVVAALMLVLTACTGLPTSGDVTVGLPLDGGDTAPDITQLAPGPVPGAGPEAIVEGFIDAAITSTDGWKTAREFLSPELADTWRPTAGVTIDAGAAARTFTADKGGQGTDRTEVTVRMEQLAHVDAEGRYTVLSGESALAGFTLARNEQGEWRITAADDGIVLDAESFPQVFSEHPLYYFDASWTRLIPDPRWFPRRTSIVTRLTQSLIATTPPEWMAPGVRSAFPAEVGLAQQAVVVDDAQVATVELTDDALGLDATTLARMRTQLQASLRDVGVEQVHFAVHGRDLNAGLATLADPPRDSGTIVLAEEGFGAMSGDELTDVPGVSAEIAGIDAELRSIELGVDEQRAAVLTADGRVFTAGDGRLDELAAGADLLPPSMDPFGYTWVVSAGAPHTPTAWRSDVTPIPVDNAFPEASSIAQFRVAGDGTRVAAVITVGGQDWIAVAAVERDADQVPISFGPTRLIAEVGQTAIDMAWVGATSIAVLTADGDNRAFVVQDIGGPGTTSSAPGGATSIAGASTLSGVRLRDVDGTVYVRRGTTWQVSLEGVLVLGTHAGR